MSRSLKYDIPGADWRVGVDEVALLGWEAIFAPTLPAPLRLVVEIGFGRGEFLLDLAVRYPGTAFVGVDLSFKRVLKMARKVAQLGVTNVRLLEGRAQVVVAQLLLPATVSEVWINFSDPWPKDRHAHRRLFLPPFVHDVARCLVPRGPLHAATDDGIYAEQIHAVLSDEKWLENMFAPRRHRPSVSNRRQTGYERDWCEANRDLYFFEYARSDADSILGGRSQ